MTDSQLFVDLNIDAYQQQFLENNVEHILLDVRELEEFAEGRIPGAVNLPLSELQMRIDEVEDGKPIVVVCAKGGRSAMAAEFMAVMGHKKLYNLSDGTFGWMRRGLPMENN